MLLYELRGRVKQLHTAVLLRKRRDADGVARLQLVLQEVAAHFDHVLHLRARRCGGDVMSAGFPRHEASGLKNLHGKGIICVVVIGMSDMQPVVILE